MFFLNGDAKLARFGGVCKNSVQVVHKKQHDTSSPAHAICAHATMFLKIYLSLGDDASLRRVYTHKK